MNLALVFTWKYNWLEHHISTIYSRISWEILKNKLDFTHYNTFYKYRYFFFKSFFILLFNHCQRNQSNQEQYSLCYDLPSFCLSFCTHYRMLHCFSTYFRKSKEIGVLWPQIPGYVFLVTMLKITILLYFRKGRYLY